MAAGRNVFLDSNTGITSGMSSFLMVYRKVTTGKEDIIISSKFGAILLDGSRTSNAKVIVDWMKQSIEKFTHQGFMIRTGSVEFQRILRLLDL